MNVNHSMYSATGKFYFRVTYENQEGVQTGVVDRENGVNPNEIRFSKAYHHFEGKDYTIFYIWVLPFVSKGYPISLPSSKASEIRLTTDSLKVQVELDAGIQLNSKVVEDVLEQMFEVYYCV